MNNLNLSQRVKELRNRKGMSQEFLADESGLSLRTIQRIENGESVPRGDTLKRLAIALETSPDELIDWLIKEDKGTLMALNLSALTFIIFPLLGIIIPQIMWVSKKDKLKGVNKVGKDLINFEITWSIILFLGLVLNIIFLISKGGDMSLKVIFVTSLLFIMIMYFLNVAFIITNTFMIQNDKNVKYFPKINFL